MVSALAISPQNLPSPTVFHCSLLSLPLPCFSLRRRLDCPLLNIRFGLIPRHTRSYPSYTSERFPLNPLTGIILGKMVAIPTMTTVFAGFLSSLTPGMSGRPGVHDLSKAVIPLSPAQQTALGTPTTSLSAVGVAFGVQNYTCSANNVFVWVSVQCVKWVLPRLIDMTGPLGPLPRFLIYPASRVATAASYRLSTVTYSRSGTALAREMPRSNN